MRSFSAIIKNNIESLKWSHTKTYGEKKYYIRRVLMSGWETAGVTPTPGTTLSLMSAQGQTVR